MFYTISFQPLREDTIAIFPVSVEIICCLSDRWVTTGGQQRLAPTGGCRTAPLSAQAEVAVYIFWFIQIISAYHKRLPVMSH